MYKIGLIGLGSVGFSYQNGQSAENLTHFEAINSNPNLELVCGVDPYRPSDWPNSISYFSDINNINMACDLFIIASPTPTHVDIVKKICNLKHPPKLLLLEKPAGKSLSDIIKINQISQNANIPIFVNFFRDCMVEDIHNFLPVEKVKYIKVNYTGTLLNSGYHFLHFVKKIMKDQIKILNITSYNDDTVYFCKIGSVDLIAFEQKNKNIPENDITFYLENSKIFYDNEKNSINFFEIKKNMIYIEEDNYSIEKTMSASLNQGFSLVYEEIVKALQGHPCKLPNIAEINRFREGFEYELK